MTPAAVGVAIALSAGDGNSIGWTRSLRALAAVVAKVYHRGCNPGGTEESIVRRIVLSFAAAALIASVALPATAQEPTEVRVTLSNFDFGPALVRVPAGKRVTLTLVNSEKGGHNFAAKEFFRAARVDPADAAKVVKGAVEVPGQRSVTITLTIDRPGLYKLKCLHFLHATFGMTGDIIVE